MSRKGDAARRLERAEQNVRDLAGKATRAELQRLRDAQRAYEVAQQAERIRQEQGWTED